MFVQNLNRTISKPNVTSGQILYCTTDCIPVDLMFQKNFPTNTSLEPPEPSKWLPTERSDLSYLSVLQQQPVLGQEHQSSGGQVFHHMHGLCWQPTDRNRRQLRSQKRQLHDGSWWSTQPLLMMAIQITHKQERGMNKLSACQPLMLVNNQKSGHQGQGCCTDWTLKGSVSHHTP